MCYRGEQLPLSGNGLTPQRRSSLYYLRFGAAFCVNQGLLKVEFFLRRSSCRRYRRCIGGQVFAFEVSANGNGIGDEGDDSHFAGTDRTDGDVDLEDSSEERGPGEAIFAGAGFLPLVFRIIFAIIN